jgi:C-5 cytosine-specific DNA methylase
METEAPTVIDLFAGASGLSEGFMRAGFKVLGAVELEEMAARTYRLNHPGVPEDRVIVADIRALPRGTLRRLAGRPEAETFIDFRELSDKIAKTNTPFGRRHERSDVLGPWITHQPSNARCVTRVTLGVAFPTSTGGYCPAPGISI